MAAKRRVGDGDGGPAFPRPASEYTADGTLADGNAAVCEQDGMSLRDYLAGQALVGVMAAYGPGVGGMSPPTVAAMAYSLADAMLDERGKAVSQ